MAYDLEGVVRGSCRSATVWNPLADRELCLRLLLGVLPLAFLDAMLSTRGAAQGVSSVVIVICFHLR
jgi:hypothetical protein